MSLEKQTFQYINRLPETWAKWMMTVGNLVKNSRYVDNPDELFGRIGDWKYYLENTKGDMLPW